MYASQQVRPAIFWCRWSARQHVRLACVGPESCRQTACQLALMLHALHDGSTPEHAFCMRSHLQNLSTSMRPAYAPHHAFLRLRVAAPLLPPPAASASAAGSSFTAAAAAVAPLPLVALLPAPAAFAATASSAAAWEALPLAALRVQQQQHQRKH